MLLVQNVYRFTYFSLSIIFSPIQSLIRGFIYEIQT